MNGVSNPMLVCAATRDELACFGLDGAREIEPGRLWKSPETTFAVTGVGIPHTLMYLSSLLETVRPACVLNIGIAGAYPSTPATPGSPATPAAPSPSLNFLSRSEELAIGDVVIGISEVFADLGMEIPDAERFRPLAAFLFSDVSLRAPLKLLVPAWAGSAAELKQGRGATVNTCTGTLETGALRRRLFDADFETMEGAAVALLCGAREIPVIEVRSISNRAARRDLRPENIRCAFESLSKFWAENRHRIGDGIGDGIRDGIGTP